MSRDVGDRTEEERKINVKTSVLKENLENMTLMFSLQAYVRY